MAASLVADYGIPTFAIKGEDNDDLLPAHQRRARPQAADDDGRRRRPRRARCTRSARDLLAGVIGGTEETTTGVIRLRAMANGRRAEVPGHRRQRRRHQAPLRQPLRHRPEHDRRHHPRDQRPARRARTSSSPATAGAARGVAIRARGMGANVIVTEVDPLRALEAVMDGFRVMPMAEAAQDRRHLRHRHRRHQRHRPAAPGGDEGRRDHGQLRPLQRRDQPPGAREAGHRRHADVRDVRRGVQPTPTAARSTCWARAG